MTKKQEHIIQINPWRLRIVIACVVMSVLFLSWRALSIQVLDNEFLQNQGDARHLRTISLSAHRGMLLDRNGDALAVSTPVASIWANPQDFDLNDERIDDLAKLLNKPGKQLKKDIAKRAEREFVYLKRHVTPQLESKILALKIPGVNSKREYRRYYPTAEVAAHVIGFTNIDDQGQEGLELALDDQLRGIPGKQQVVKDRYGYVVSSVDLLEAPVAGKDVSLSIDRRLQYIAYRELKSAVQRNKAKSGSLVLLDAKSGEVLAMVNQPSFNPNNRRNLKSAVFRNRAVMDQFEPGSVLKPFTVSAALRSEEFQADSLIDTAPGYFRVSGSTISDFRNYGVLDVGKVLQKSSNIGAAKMALTMPKELMWETFSDLGFGTAVNSGFPGETSGRLPFFGEWNQVERATMAFGYGMTTSTLQLAKVYSVLANNGISKPVSFLHQEKPVEGVRVLDENIAKTVRGMLERVVGAEGTGRLADVTAYRVAGKTGTARVAGNGGYLEDKHRALFAGMAPASDPKLVAVVVIDEPGGDDYYGGKVAAPVFSSVMAAALRLMNIPPDDGSIHPMPPGLRMAEARP